MTELRLDTLQELGPEVAVPSYAPAALSIGIVHFGVGGFHRSHEAMYLDRLLSGGEAAGWGICGVGVLPSDARMRDIFAAQDNLYTLVTRHPDGSSQARVIGAIAEYLFAPDAPDAVLARLTDPATRIVSLTITEGGYGVNDATGEYEATGPGTLHDLTPGAVPKTVFGFLTEALRRRRDAGTAPFTVMSCDNMQGNGHVAKLALSAFARLKDPELGEWIARQVAFPNSMVDRITPVTTDQTRADLLTEYGVEDGWPVLAESFAQWVLEDHFPSGRPALETVGVQVVADVEPYELMKLRLLNASHQVMGYLGLLAGSTYVHEVCREPLFTRFLLGYMQAEATPTLRPVPGIDLEEYQRELLTRFGSAAIQDTLERLVVDGSDRIPKFLLPVVRAQLETGGEIAHSALAVAAWSVWLEGEDEAGHALALQDKRLPQLQAAVQREAVQPGAFLDLKEVFGTLGESERFRTAYLAARASLRSDGAVQSMKALLDG